MKMHQKFGMYGCRRAIKQVFYEKPNEHQIWWSEYAKKE